MLMSNVYGSMLWISGIKWALNTSRKGDKSRYKGVCGTI
jgi:hypothetical protein